MQETKLNIPRAKVLGIQFSVMPKDVVCNFHRIDEGKETQQQHYQELDDKHLGVVFQEDGDCKLCGGTAAVRHGEMPCPGHMGAIHLRETQWIYHPLLLDKLAMIMNIFCPICHKMKWRELMRKKGVQDLDEQNRILKQMKDVSPMYKFLQRISEDVRELICCEQRCIFKPKAETNKIERTVFTKADKQQPSEELPCHKANEILSKIDLADLEVLGLKHAHPQNMILQYIPVMPVCCRPNIQQMGMISRDAMTDQYQRIMKVINQSFKETNGQKELEDLRQKIAGYYRQLMKTSGADEDASEEKLKGISERLKGKPGRMRMNVMGKRVNYCSRSVISGDPTISVDQLGVPKTVAMKLTFPEVVTERNIEFLQKVVNNGTQYPGANAIERGQGELQKLEMLTQEKVQLQVGEIVHRHLRDDDYVMFNRQPSLHKMSFMAHRVKVLPYSTFRLNLSVTKPYNADFDGDEMNCHEPQSYQAISELSEIMAVPKQIVSCKNNAPLIGIFQDTLVGCYVLTQKDIFVDKQNFQKYMAFLEYPNKEYKMGFAKKKQDTGEQADDSKSASFHTFSGTNQSSKEHSNNHQQLICTTTPQPAILFPKPQWTGKQLFSMSIPDKLTMQIGSKTDKQTCDNIKVDKFVQILGGNLLTGIVGDKVVGQAQGGLIHVLWKDISPDACKAFLNNCQRTINQMLVDYGFSVGFGDMIINMETRDKAAAMNNTLLLTDQQLVADSMMHKIKLAPGQTNEQGFEGSLNTKIAKTGDDLVNIVKDVLPKRNALVCMANAGSKGKNLNIMQIAACLGQQQLQAQRMVYRFLTYRSLPHFQPFDYELHSRGYVKHSFIQGLDPQEFYFHMTGGREGVCDTAIKTADSGYVERKMMKNMESITQAYDSSVRNDQNRYVQLRYGDDNLNTHMCESREYDFIGYSDLEFYKCNFIDFDQQLEKVQKRGRREQEVQQITFEQLIPAFEQFEQSSQGNYVLSSNSLLQFNIIIDPDLINHQKLLDYLIQHMSVIVKRETDQTTPLENWMSNEAIRQIRQDSQLLKLEYLVLLTERYWLQQIHTKVLQQNQSKEVEFIKTTACDLTRILRNQVQSVINNKTPLIISDKLPNNSNVDKAQTDLDQKTVITDVNRLLVKLSSNKVRSFESKIFRVLVRQTLSSKAVCFTSRLNRLQFNIILKQIEEKFNNAIGVPGEPVGPLASHSISEPATQLTLNTFHVAGTSALGQLGLPRLKELIDFRNTKIPIMSIYMKESASTSFISQINDHTKMQAAIQQRYTEQSAQLMKVAALIENAKFFDFVKQWQVIFDPNDDYEEDQQWLGFAKEVGIYNNTDLSPFVLRYELSLKKMIEKQEILSLEDIVKLIKGMNKNELNVQYYTGLERIVIRVKTLRQDKTKSQYNVQKFLVLNNQIQQLHICGNTSIHKVFQNSIVPFVHYGFDQFTPDVNRKDFEREKFGKIYRSKLNVQSTKKFADGKTTASQVEELIIQTEGSDLVNILGMDDVDATRTCCNDLPEVYNVLGVEAARALLATEMRNTLPSDGLNQRHFALLADLMMGSPSEGKMISINRHGMRNTNTGVITQASFEQPAEAFLIGGAFGLYDNCQAVSTAVATGAEMKHGTGSFTLLLDTKMLPQIPDSIHPQRQVNIKKELEKRSEATLRSESGGVISTIQSQQGGLFSFGSQRRSAATIRSQFSMRGSVLAPSVMTMSQQQISGGNIITERDPYSIVSQKTTIPYNASRVSMSHVSLSQHGMSTLHQLSVSQRTQQEQEEKEDKGKEEKGEQNEWI